MAAAVTQTCLGSPEGSKPCISHTFADIFFHLADQNHGEGPFSFIEFPNPDRLNWEQFDRQCFCAVLVSEGPQQTDNRDPLSAH